MGDQYEVSYHLTRTIVRVTAVITTKRNLATGELESSGTADLEVLTEADPAAVARLELDENKLSDTSVDLKFATDGRLLSAESEVKGRIGEIIRGGVQILTSIASIAVAVVGGSADRVKSDDPIQDAYAAAHPDAAAARSRLRAAASSLLGSLSAAAAALAATEEDEARKALLEKIKGVETTLKTVRAEQELIEQHFSAWKTTAEGAVVETKTFDLEIGDLPRVQDSLPAEWDVQARPQSMDAADLFERAKIIVVALDDTRRPEPHADLSPAPAIYYRHPRRVELGIYVCNEKETPVLTKRVPALVFDRYSRVATFPLGKSVFATKSASVVIGSHGSLDTLSNATTSPVAEVTGVLKELPGDVVGALEKANKIVEHERTLSTARLDRRLNELEKEKKLLEAQIAEAGLSATRTYKVELEKIKAQIDVAKNKKELAGLE